MELFTKAGRVLSKIAASSGKIFVNIATLPYYRTFRQHTVYPILEIIQCHDDTQLADLLEHWRNGKIREIWNVKVSCTVMAAAIIGCFGWTNIESTYWLARALWYSSLTLSITAVITSAQHTVILESMGPSTPGMNPERVLKRILNVREVFEQELSPPATPDEEKSGITITVRRQQRSLNWNMMFVWQFSMMLYSYSWVLFLGGLTIHVCTPLIEGHQWGDDTRIAIIYLITAFVAFVNFVWCSYWAYYEPDG